jgi:hypothetical protein
MRSRSKRGPGLARLLIIATVLGALTVVPFPIGKSAVEAWSQDEGEAADGRATRLERSEGGATDVPEDTSGLAVGSSAPQQAAGDYAGGLEGRRTNLIAVLVGMLAVLLILRWHLSSRGRQHYPRPRS